MSYNLCVHKKDQNCPECNKEPSPKMDIEEKLAQALELRQALRLRDKDIDEAEIGIYQEIKNLRTQSKTYNPANVYQLTRTRND